MTDQLPDALRVAQPLLHKNTITVPQDFGNGGVFRELSWAINWVKGNFDEDDENPRVLIRCIGDGGETSDLLAVVDLLRAEAADGTRIEGYLYGNSYSAHAVFWAACPYRYVLPNSCLYVHSCRQFISSKLVSLKSAEEMTRVISQTNHQLASVLASACGEAQFDESYWMSVFDEYDEDAFLRIPAEDLVHKYKMGEMYDV